jgi:serine/threonine-protein kinase
VGLLSRIVWRAKTNRPLAVAVLAFCLTLLGFFGYGVNTYAQSVRKEREAKRQAELAQRLGQEVTVMEWLLRTSRVMPLHDLEREKGIVRQRMANLKTDMHQYGELAAGLAHYALGRGHLAMHEYPEALAELQLAVQSGQDGPEVHYALGLTMGKHFEKAMYEARLSGGGEFAQKQLSQIAPKYLSPALRSLERARAMPLDAPQYLEALIAFYQRDYQRALQQAEVALQTAPWLYEATKLQGDVHLERALQARDSGTYEEAEQEFAAAVKKYSEAGAAGESDGEVFEGLAEAWVRKMEMDVDRGQPSGGAYDAALAAGDKITASDSQSIAGHLKNSFAAVKTMSLVADGKSSADRVERCLAEASAVLRHKPEHPYAREMAANCYVFASELAQGRGEDPEALLRKPMELLEPAVKQNPQFLWGLNDLSTAYAVLGMYLQSKGHSTTRQTFESSLEYAGRAMALDNTYLTPIQNSLFIWARLVSTASSEGDLQQMLARADDFYAKCMKINDKYQQCNINNLLVYARAAQRMMEGGRDPQAPLMRAFQMQAQIRKLGGSFLDAEQYAALAHYVEAREKLKRGQDPGDALTEVEGALKRCFAQAEKDTLCRTLAAQAEWVKAERQGDGKKKAAALKEAQRKAEEATQSPEKTPEAWQVLAETHLRQASVEGVPAKERETYIAQGLGAVDKALAMNRNHAQSQMTRGDLYLLRAKVQKDARTRATDGQLAIQSYQQAMKTDPYLTAPCMARIAEALEVAGRG